MNIEKAIDGLKRMKIGLFNAKIDKEPIGPYLDSAISALEAQQADRWIPISSGRLPEEPVQRVNVTLKNEMVLEVWYINNEFKLHEELKGGGLKKVSEYNPVIAWKPLDEPWKEEQP